MRLNCQNAIKCGKCKGDCCGIVPIPIKTWEKFKHRQQRIVTGVINFLNGTVIPETKENVCPFLDLNYKCVIYKDRPFVCQKFGDGTDPKLVCPYLTPKGELK